MILSTILIMTVIYVLTLVYRAALLEKVLWNLKKIKKEN